MTLPVQTIVTSASYVLSELSASAEFDVLWRPAEIGIIERGNAAWLAVKTERGTALYLLAPPFPDDAPALKHLAA